MKKTLTLVITLLVIITGTFMFASCGPKVPEPPDYKTYNLAKFQAEDWNSKEVQYFFRPVNANSKAPVLYFYKDGGITGAQYIYNAGLVAVTGKPEYTMFYYGYWSEKEDGSLDIYTLMGWEDPDGIIEIEIENFAALKAEGEGQFTLTWKVHSASQPSYRQDSALATATIPDMNLNDYLTSIRDPRATE